MYLKHLQSSLLGLIRHFRVHSDLRLAGYLPGSPLSRSSAPPRLSPLPLATVTRAHSPVEDEERVKKF